MAADRLTLDEHAEIGAELHALRLALLDVVADVARRYPKSHRYHRKLLAAVDALDAARSAGDDAFADEHPTDFAPSAYYPGSVDDGTAR